MYVHASFHSANAVGVLPTLCRFIGAAKYGALLLDYNNA